LAFCAKKNLATLPQTVDYNLGTKGEFPEADDGLGRKRKLSPTPSSVSMAFEKSAAFGLLDFFTLRWKGQGAVSSSNQFATETRKARPSLVHNIKPFS
jgi:hypothetical protein